MHTISVKRPIIGKTIERVPGQMPGPKDDLLHTNLAPGGARSERFEGLYGKHKLTW